jgi:hypothetical protein
MKIEIIYYELHKKEFRSEKALTRFLNDKVDTEMVIVRASEIKKGIYYSLNLNEFFIKYT